MLCPLLCVWDHHFLCLHLKNQWQPFRCQCRWSKEQKSHRGVCVLYKQVSIKQQCPNICFYFPPCPIPEYWLVTTLGRDLPICFSCRLYRRQKKDDIQGGNGSDQDWSTLYLRFSVLQGSSPPSS